MRELEERYQKGGKVSERRIGQVIPYFAEGFATVADAVLFILQDFGGCAADVGEQENRIVAKTVGAARLVGNHSLDQIGNDGERASPARESSHADESRATLRPSFARHLSQQFLDAIRVGALRSRVPRGIDAGCSAKRRNHETRIFGHKHFICKAAVIQRLADGIFGKSRRSLFEWRQPAKIRQQIEIERGTAGQFAILPQLPCIRRREQQANRSSLPCCAIAFGHGN